MNSQKNVLFLETATNFAAYGLRVIHCLICNLRQVRESVFLCCELITTALLRLKQLLGKTWTTKNYYTLIKHSYSGWLLQRCFGDICYQNTNIQNIIIYHSMYCDQGYHKSATSLLICSYVELRALEAGYGHPSFCFRWRKRTNFPHFRNVCAIMS